MIWIALIAARFLFIAFPKRMLAVTGIAAALLLIIYLLLVAYGDNRQKEQDAVVVSVKFDTKACGTNLPLHVTIKNDGVKTVSKVEWSFEAHHPGYSERLTYQNASSDKILAKGESSNICFRAPRIEDGSEARRSEE